MKQKLLPRYCYPGRSLTEVKAIVIHFFSAINVAQDKWDDTDTCWELFRELNLPGSKRGAVLPKSKEERTYASAHYLIPREGDPVQLLSENLVAWHAGKSEWAGRENLNEWSIGIELIGHETSGYTDSQYLHLQTLCAQLMTAHGVKLTNIVGHDVVAPGRKKDPGPLFDWERLRRPLKGVGPFSY